MEIQLKQKQKGSHCYIQTLWVDSVVSNNFQLLKYFFLTKIVILALPINATNIMVYEVY